MATTDRITRFGLRNFKAFHYLEDTDIRPLTVLVGANSAGKSSLLQSLLLLKQTSEADRFSGVLKFDGEWTKLGGFSTVVSNFDTQRTIEYRFVVEYRATSDGSAFWWPGTRPSRRATPEEKSAKSEVVITFGLRSSANEVVVTNFTLRSWIPETMAAEDGVVLTVLENGTSPRIENMPRSAIPFGPKHKRLDSVTLDKFWPVFLGYETDDDEHPGRFGYPLAILDPISQPMRILQRSFGQRLEYLGPIRADPRPFYPVEETPDIGPRG